MTTDWPTLLGYFILEVRFIERLLRAGIMRHSN
jgi:hypothetical protein